MPPTLVETFPLRDQRTMVGVAQPEQAHTSTDEVEAAWKAWARTHGLAARARTGDTSRELEESGETVDVYVSGGKWIASCPRCNGGIAGWPFHERGCCLDCGTIYKLAYPLDADGTAELARLLAERPEPHRNFLPQLGDTLDTVREAQPRYIGAPAKEVTLNLAELSDEQRHTLANAGLL